MPDTHLVMPRTLSAPYAELLEAETPQTMTASDAPPNGTAAAAAAFARLLASGDHAMQPESYTLTGGPALPPQARDTAHHSSDLRATLLGSTAIPAGNAHPDVEILKLGLRRAELIQRIDQSGPSGHDVAPLLIEWKEVDHLIMELQPKTAAGLAVQLSVIWRQFDLEPGEEHGPTADSTLDRVWLWTAMKNAERIGAGAPPAHDRQDADAPIFAAYSRWSQLVRDCYAATTDEDCERLSEQADEAALDVMTHEPATREGLAAQVFVMLHLEHGGTTDDHLDIDFSALTGGDGPDSAAVQALVERVKRIGRRDGEETPQGALTSLYARWVEVRARYLANDEGDTLQAELDQIEDRLEAEPVRCVADAIAKLGYFLTASNSMLDDGILPSIDADGSTAWQRLLFTVEGATERLAVDTQAPFRAMVTELRQLMRRHVKLEEEAERRVEAYQLPEEVSRAMQAAYTRAVADSAADDAQEPERAKEQQDEVLVRFRAMKPESRKSFLSFMRFMTVSDHLHGAMLGFAREHGMTRHYSEWLKGHLTDLAGEQGSAITRDGLQKKSASNSEISSAYDALLDAMKAESALPEDMSDEEREPYENKMMAAADHLADLAPKTLCDAAILLRYLFLRNCDTLEAERAFLRGTEPNEADLVDFRARILWQVVKMLEALPAAANDQHQEPDAFADTIAAFEAEAPATLALPQEPTGRMVDAGVSAAGITPAQFQAAYAAAVEALKLERAA